MRPRAGYDCTTSAKGRESGCAAYHFVRARMGVVRPARASLGGCPHRHGLYFPKQVGASPGPWTPRGTDAMPVGASAGTASQTSSRAAARVVSKHLQGDT